MKKIFQTLCLFVFMVPCSLVAKDNGPKKVEVHMKVLLISIENYEKAPLKYATNDIEKLSSLFQTRFGAISRAIIDRPVSGTDYKASMEKAISEWCADLKDEDTCILYLAGHGVVGPDDRLYLPMVDFNLKNHDTAAIPMQWIRDKLAGAKGKCKLILLDTCFAGTSRSLEDFKISNSEQMAKTFDDLPKVATLASSRGNQKSWLWMERKHSLYTYWLIEGFRGNADTNNDLVLDISELFNYLDKNIAWISSQDSRMERQNPILLNDKQIKDSFRLPLLAGTSEDALENAASLLDLYLQRSESGTVMVPEFTTGKASDEEQTIQDSYGTLPRTYAHELRSLLTEHAHSGNVCRHHVLNPNATQG